MEEEHLQDILENYNDDEFVNLQSMIHDFIQDYEQEIDSYHGYSTSRTLCSTFSLYIKIMRK